MALVVGGTLMSLGAVAQNPDPPRWTLADALDSALDRSPVLLARQATRQEVASRLVGARTYPHNPELALELADRSSPDGSSTDRGLSLTQELELAGQRRKRVAVAEAELTAAEAVFERDRQRLMYDIELAFAEAVRARELLAVAETEAALAQEAFAYWRRRLDRGAATQIEVNFAQASAGRAARSVERARSDYASARSRLAEVAGADPTLSPAPIGELDLPTERRIDVDGLVASAVARRGDARALEHQVLAAEAATRLARAESRPNLVVAGFVQREEGTDDIVGGSLGVSLPIFDRNQGQLAESRATRERLRHERDALRLAITREVTSAASRLQSARAAAEHLRDQVLGTLDENVELLQRSFEAGRIGATEVVTLRREFMASRREYIEALADAWLARIELDLATGRLAPPIAHEKELS